MRINYCRLLAPLLASVLASSGLAACASSLSDGQSTLVVQQSGRAVGHFALSQLQRLPQIEVVTPQSHGAQVQKGPTVHSILDAAGVTAVERVRVEGRDPAQTLTAAELTDQVILNVTKRNTLKLTGSQLPRERWVRDVTTLVVNP